MLDLWTEFIHLTLLPPEEKKWLLMRQALTLCPQVFMWKREKGPERLLREIIADPNLKEQLHSP